MQSRGKAAATIANDLSELSAVWKWAIAHGKATENPFAGILPPKKARNRKATRRPFTDSEARTILAAARREHGALRWLPWVLAATGARLTEVCQGTKADVIGRDGLTFLRIHADDEKRAIGEAQRSVKNAGSERMVPIHPCLAAEGFLTYAADLPAGSPLFPDIEPDKLFGQRGTSAQKLMGRWLRKTLNITDKKISPSHSWRHWFIDKARTAGLHPEIRNALTGHADDGNESHKYGLGWKAMPRALADAMAAIEFPDL
jgi:integrase